MDRLPMTDKRPNHREVQLLDTLRSFGGSARSAALAEALQVSEETVRRTVKALAKSGLVQRVHGGVFLANAESRTSIVSRMEQRSAEKARIGSKAAKLVADGTTVFLDVGSTTAYVAESLAARRNLTVVTNGLHAAQALAKPAGNRVFLAGGELRTVENGVFGAATIEFVQRFNIDVAVLSVDGIDPAAGFLLTGAAEAELARAVAPRARRTIVVADHNKFGQSAPMIACDPADIDTLVTDTTPEKVFADRIAAWDIELVAARKD